MNREQIVANVLLNFHNTSGARAVLHFVTAFRVVQQRSRRAENGVNTGILLLFVSREILPLLLFNQKLSTRNNCVHYSKC